jgi:hypothetical protein
LRRREHAKELGQWAAAVDGVKAELAGAVRRRHEAELTAALRLLLLRRRNEQIAHLDEVGLKAGRATFWTVVDSRGQQIAQCRQ